MAPLGDPESVECEELGKISKETKYRKAGLVVDVRVWTMPVTIEIHLTTTLVGAGPANGGVNVKLKVVRAHSVSLRVRVTRKQKLSHNMEEEEERGKRVPEGTTNEHLVVGE